MSILSNTIDIKLRDYTRELVCVPFRFGCNSDNPTINQYFNENGDGSGTGLAYIVAAGIQHSNTSFSGYFRGTVFGIRFDPVQVHSSTSWMKNFSVVIDGRAYRVDKALWNNETNVLNDDYFESNSVIIARNLPDCKHRFTIMFVSSNTDANQTWIYGLLLEKRAGYKEQPNNGVFYYPGSLTTTFIHPMTTYGLGRTTPTTIRKIIYYNTGSADSYVYLKLQGFIFDSFKVSPTSSYHWEPGTRLISQWGNGSSDWTHACSGSILYTTIGEQ